ncbi:hypothetical protein J5J10_04880 [Ciceribacter sp. L1K23]|uniref:hypothetical protein n=1 Tax=Ciceribacter sp. L1K23 TaxID=2820276 RepID=UPI001B81C762|nr:hypothetical protein [Ciceribacter sp. L1K23]MBR0555009.1 hypothetical protein [Ciceribacter sp. L1K23]
MADITNETIARQIMAEFNAFKDTYDRYLDRMDDLVCSLGENSKIRLKARYLVVNTTHISQFIINGSYVVRTIDGMLKKGEV